MSNKIYRTMGVYNSSNKDCDHGDIVYHKLFESLDEAISDFYRIIKINISDDGFALLYNTILKNYKNNIRYVDIAVDAHCEENHYFVTLTVDEIDEPVIYNCEPMFIGRMPIPQIELDDGTVVKRLQFLSNDIALECFSGYLSIENILFEDWLEVSNPETLKKISKVLGPWTVDEVREELKRMYVEKTL